MTDKVVASASTTPAGVIVTARDNAIELARNALPKEYWASDLYPGILIGRIAIRGEVEIAGDMWFLVTWSPPIKCLDCGGLVYRDTGEHCWPANRTHTAHWKDGQITVECDDPMEGIAEIYLRLVESGKDLSEEAAEG